jgi:hypothetical protein
MGIYPISVVHKQSAPTEKKKIEALYVGRTTQACLEKEPRMMPSQQRFFATVMWRRGETFNIVG